MVDEETLRRYRAWGGQMRGTVAEFLVFEFLEKRKKLRPYVDFEFDPPKFDIPLLNAVWYVEREEPYSPLAESELILYEARLVEHNIQLIRLDSEDVRERTEYTLRTAWQGNQP